MKQKVIKVGNSAAVTIPKEFVRQTGIKIGDELNLETDLKLKMMILKTSDSPYQAKITPEFKNWLDAFVRKNKSLLQILAKTPNHK